MSMSELVIREVTKGVWTFSRPFARFGIMPVGGRSTAIQLRAGGVWILASTPLDAETKSTLDGLGHVKYIVGADTEHHLYLSEYKKAYPSAKLIAPEEAMARPGNKDLAFEAWSGDSSKTTYGFEDEVDYCYFSGFRNKDVAFLHKPSKSLIEADLLFNLPCKEQYSKTKTSNMFLGMGLGPSSWIHSQFIWSLGTDKAAMKRDAKTVADWDFERIIPCHGDVIETNAKQAWKDAFKAFLD